MIRIINIDGRTLRTHIIHCCARMEALRYDILLYDIYYIIYMIDHFDRSCGIPQHVCVQDIDNKHSECVMRKEN